MKNKPKFNIEEKSFGTRLAKIRGSKGLTQKELGEKIGISQRMVAYYESQTEHPPATLLPSIAKVLKISLDELLGIKNIKIKESATSLRSQSKLKIIDKLAPKHRKAVIDYASALLLKQQNEEKHK